MGKRVYLFYEIHDVDSVEGAKAVFTRILRMVGAGGDFLSAKVERLPQMPSHARRALKGLAYCARVAAPFAASEKFHHQPATTERKSGRKNKTKMNGTSRFQEVIAAYLDQRAAEDEHFAARRDCVARPIGDIIACILNDVQASGVTAMTDEEVFGLAVHYAEEAEVEVKEAPRCNIVMSRAQLTDDDRAEARRLAMAELQRQEMERLRRPATPKKPKAPEPQEAAPSLFDF